MVIITYSGLIDNIINDAQYKIKIYLLKIFNLKENFVKSYITAMSFRHTENTSKIALM